ncbi:MAG TPA: alpha-amylase family glycosyl hydrolase [Chthoniobacterales bacterium]|nr:alpha-amylase family glycosyl hydrolase [Chthoniobacterales bacterium]
MHKQTISGSNGATIAISLSDVDLVVEYRAPDFVTGRCAVFVTVGTHREIGAAIVPFQRGAEGSTVFLPFKADLLVWTGSLTESSLCNERKWERWKWSDAASSTQNRVKIDNGTLTIQLPRSQFGEAKRIDCAVYAKDFSENDGWGKFFGCNDRSIEAGTGDKYISQYLEIDLHPASEKIARPRTRLGSPRMRIYQLFVRLFGNINETRKPNGTIGENGVGKFNDINDAALSSLREMGFTHIWLTGVLQQATGTDYSIISQPADDPDLLKGVAGSPYAIKDYFDVCPDYAEQPAERLEEFKELLGRIHNHGMKALIDFVPNHVARSHNSDVRPDLNFGAKGNSGAGDDMSIFFSPQNNFFYLQPDGGGPPLQLPTWKNGQPVSPTCKLPEIKCDGFFGGEMKFGRVTGNNVVSWTPSINDWYETAKLNYGFDFTDPTKSRREYPNANAPEKIVPDTWNKMDRVVEHWQALGVDGFRCDMAHMVPPEFWKWIIGKARIRHVDVVFIGEAYDNDPMKVPGVDPVISKHHDGRSNVMFDLLDAGFNGVYDDPTYRALKKIYEGPGWANDIDGARSDDFIFENSLRYAENHDEVRIAAQSQWGGFGMKVGVPVSAILFGLSRGPIMLYNGQEVGEPGEGLEGFGGNDARTSIFDYWSMPEFAKWVNGHKYDGGRLSAEQKQLRSFYGRLLNILGEPAFRDGACIPLNAVNRDNPNYGRLPNEQPSGHWLYSFLRHDPESRQTFLIVVNLNPHDALKNVRIAVPSSVAQSIGFNEFAPGTRIYLKDRLAIDGATSQTSVAETMANGILIVDLAALTPLYLEMSIELL